MAAKKEREGGTDTAIGAEHNVKAGCIRILMVVYELSLTGGSGSSPDSPQSVVQNAFDCYAGS